MPPIVKIATNARKHARNAMHGGAILVRLSSHHTPPTHLTRVHLMDSPLDGIQSVRDQLVMNCYSIIDISRQVCTNMIAGFS